MQASSVTSLSPSFNSYSNTRLAEIAARVVEEFDSEEFYDEFYFEREETPAAEGEQNSEYLEKERGDSDEEKEFEFAFVNKETEFPSLISADEIFHNGQIRPVYPVFNRDFFFERSRFQQENIKGEKGVRVSDPTIRLPLRKLFIEERETTMTMTTTSSSSSSEADELDGLPEESYCVWQPKVAAEERCKKSGSAGSNSRRWKFKDLLHRSHSDGGKDSFVFLSHSNSGRKKQNDAPARGGKVMSAAAPPPPPPPVLNAEKRRSYLPYRQDLVGFFANVNGLSKNLQPF